MYWLPRKRLDSSSSYSMSAVTADIESAFATIVERGAGALFVGTGAFYELPSERIVALAARHTIPASLSPARVCRGRRPNELWD